ncbi:hypothetical protein APHAL10511_005861 [Amanita phalloides]|nr:hypothetical protein APHAL10511_005861 [Amanita phalloides]
MWHTLRNLAAGKVVVVTTHSMEEASALADRVGIQAVGSVESLSARYAEYQIHFSCRAREDFAKIQNLMATLPGSRMVDDVATRFEVPIETKSASNVEALSLARLFSILANLTTNGGDDSGIEFTVERTTLQSVFLKVIRDNNVHEEEADMPMFSLV